MFTVWTDLDELVSSPVSWGVYKYVNVKIDVKKWYILSSSVGPGIVSSV